MADSVSSESPGTDGFALHCRGDVRLCRGEADCTPKSRKGRALLAVLAAEERPLSRVKIIDLLWSDRQEEQARASLRTLLADLRSQFNSRFDDLPVVERERIALGPAVRTDLSAPLPARPAGELFEGLDHIDPELDEWLRVEREKWSREGAVPMDGGRPPSALRGSAASRWTLAAVLLLAVVAAVLLYLQPWATPAQPVVAVLKFKDLTGRNALLADGIAEELRIHLAHHPNIQVIGRESSESADLQIANAVVAARDKLDATHVVEGTVLEHEGAPAVSARVVATRTSRAMWTDVLKPQGMSLTRSAGQIAARIANNINETVGQGAGAAFEADPTTYVDLFRARQLNSHWDSRSTTEARKILGGILERNPGFAPALALMAESTIRASDHPSFGGKLPLVAARAEAVGYAERALKAAPAYGPAHLAMGLALKDTGRELPHLKRAAELSPGTVEIHRQYARALETRGDLSAAFVHYSRAAALDPLNLRMAIGLERALAFTGRRDEISQLLADFTRRSGSRADVLRLIQVASFDTGDLSKGYIAGLEAVRADPRDWIAANNLMTMDVWFGRPSQALARARQAGMDLSGWTPTLIRRDIPAIEAKMNATGREFWFTDWAREDASELLVAGGRAASLLALYDRTRSATGGNEPGPRAIPAALVTAVHELRGRRAARKLLDQLRPAWAELSREYPPGRRALFAAYIAGYEGDDENAIWLLELAVKDHWTNLGLALVPVEEVSAFRSLRRQPRFLAVVRAHKENIEREKRELDTELKRVEKGSIVPERMN